MNATIRKIIVSNYQVLLGSYNIKKINLTIFLFLLIGWQAYAQVHSSKQMIPLLHNEIEGFIGSTHVPEGSFDDSGATLLLPNIGLNYKYWINEKFAIGWYNNIVALSYKVSSDTHQILDREYPVISTLVGIFSPLENLTIFTGPGLEIDQNKSLFVFRFGVDYSFPLSNDWFLTPRFIFDNIGGDIHAYTIGIGGSKRF